MPEGTTRPGLPDPVIDAQTIFRALMEAMARPATPRDLPAPLDPPAPLTPELAAVALTLADHEAGLALSASLDVEPVKAFLRFHTGAPLAEAPEDAAFLLIAPGDPLPPAEKLALGSDAYPDRSTTLVVALDSLDTGETLTVEGPGLAAPRAVALSPLPAGLVELMAGNRTLFPRGVDVILVAPGRIAALARTSRLIEGG